MIPSIEKSEKFQQEISSCFEKISLISDEKKRNDATNLLKNLILEVRRIDSFHENILQTRSLPSSVNDSRLKSTDIRKKLNQLLI
jgi:hypothetical protein